MSNKGTATAPTHTLTPCSLPFPNPTTRPSPYHPNARAHLLLLTGPSPHHLTRARATSFTPSRLFRLYVCTCLHGRPGVCLAAGFVVLSLSIPPFSPSLSPSLPLFFLSFLSFLSLLFYFDQPTCGPHTTLTNTTKARPTPTTLLPGLPLFIPPSAPPPAASPGCRRALKTSATKAVQYLQHCIPQSESSSKGLFALVSPLGGNVFRESGLPDSLLSHQADVTTYPPPDWIQSQRGSPAEYDS